MVTRHWKTVKGMMETYPVSESLSGQFAKRLTLYNVKNVSGEYVEEIVFASSGTTAQVSAITGLMVTRNNSVLLSYHETTNPSNDPNTALYGSTTNTWTGGGFKVCVGSGTTPPTIDDYTLESPLLDKVTLRSTNRGSFEYDETTGNFVNLVTITGVANEELIIAEVGIIKSLYVVYSGGSNNAGANSAENYTNILAVREVLPTPLELKAGDAFTITIKVEM